VFFLVCYEIGEVSFYYAAVELVDEILFRIATGQQ